MTAFLALAAAYLIGAIPTGYVVAKLWGLGDIRRHGSGNIGATNVLRTLGRGPAVLTLVGDTLKGALAVLAGGALAPGDGRVLAACAVAAVVGNCWSVFLRFRGGKGVATGLGALLVLVPWATLPAAVVWAAIAATFRYISLGSVMAAVTVPLGALILYSPASAAAAGAVAVIVVVRHQENLARLLAGTERRIGQRDAA